MLAKQIIPSCAKELDGKGNIYNPQSDFLPFLQKPDIFFFSLVFNKLRNFYPLQRRSGHYFVGALQGCADEGGSNNGQIIRPGRSSADQVTDSQQLLQLKSSHQESSKGIKKGMNIVKIIC